MVYLSDEEVMAQIQNGQLNLLGVLFTRYADKAFGLCYSIVGEAHVCDDLVQEAFLRVLRYRDSFRGDARFSTWLYRIVKNVCHDHLRLQGKENTVRSELIHSATDFNVNTFSDDSDIAVAVVRTAFGKLSPEQRELLVKSRIEGIGYAEIAQHFRISKGAARVRVHRALRELKSIVTELQESEA